MTTMARLTKGDQPGELMQFAILTLAMLGGGFAALFVILNFIIVPRLEAKVDVERSMYQQLRTLLHSDEMKALRREAKAQEGSTGERMLVNVLTEEMNRYGLVPEREQRLEEREVKPGLIEQTQKLNLRPAPMVKILQFVASVANAKKTIHVEQVQLNRPKTDTDSWSALISFVDYAVKQ
jgi:type II secretory pathway component PulM